MTNTTTAPQRGVLASFATMRTLTRVFVGSVTLMFAMTAMATSTVWTFDNALFQNGGGVAGGAASGSFTFDTVTETYSDIDISTSTSTGLLNQYDAVFSGRVASSTQLSVVSSGSQGGPVFEFLWNTPLSDADLERTFVGVDVGGEDPFGLECLSSSVMPDCTGQSRSIATGGKLTASEAGLGFATDGLFYITTGGNTVEVTGRAAGNSDTDINIPGTVNNGGITYSVTSIGTRAFEDNLLTSVTIGNRVETLEEKALKGNSLTSVTIPSSVTRLGEKAFEKNKISSLKIPPSVTTIELNAFNKNALTRVVFEGNYGTFNNDTMFDVNPDLAALTYCAGAAGWSEQLFFNGASSIKSTPINCLSSATPVPAAPLWLLGIMAGLLSLVGISKLRKA
jgi:hypothetical protein